MISRPKSITSNDTKLYHHLDSIQSMQEGRAQPVLLHVSPTNACSSNCVHCCFSERDKSLQLPIEAVVQTASTLRRRGLQSLEYTGGGEPTMWQPLVECIRRIADIGLRQGMNTNANVFAGHAVYSSLDWCRVALNIVDSADEEKIRTFVENVKRIQEHTHVTACYIVPQQVGIKNLSRVVELAEELALPTRIAPDCIQSLGDIEMSITKIKSALAHVTEEGANVFVSDFNVYTEPRVDSNCWLHYLKPFLYTDGWIYSCPSSELAMENGRNMDKATVICHHTTVEQTYGGSPEPRHRTCSYCKYTRQNNIITAAMTETDFDEFV